MSISSPINHRPFSSTSISFLSFSPTNDRNFARAIELFEKALQEVSSHSEMRAANGESAVKIMQGNVDEARLGLAEQEQGLGGKK